MIPSFQIHYMMHCASPRQHFTVLSDYLQFLEFQISSLYRTISAAIRRMQVWTCQQWPCLLTMKSLLTAEQGGFVIVTGFRLSSCADKRHSNSNCQTPEIHHQVPENGFSIKYGMFVLLVEGLMWSTLDAELSIQQNPFGILHKTQSAFGKPNSIFFLKSLH